MNKEAKTKELWDNSAPSYSNAIQRQLLDGSREIWLDLILSNAPDKERLDVLDLGTGPGFFSIILALEGHRAVGIDASPLMLETARENARVCGANAEFLQMNIQELDFPDNSLGDDLARLEMCINGECDIAIGASANYTSILKNFYLFDIYFFFLNKQEVYDVGFA